MLTCEYIFNTSDAYIYSKHVRRAMIDLPVNVISLIQDQLYTVNVLVSRRPLIQTKTVKVLHVLMAFTQFLDIFKVTRTLTSESKQCVPHE